MEAVSALSRRVGLPMAIFQELRVDQSVDHRATAAARRDAERDS
ncbi:hypothetical protein V5P93_003778 [Actinokineospora auranticolor]|nr:hypothetical protein [Actinokineospora auranticolor]